MDPEEREEEHRDGTVDAVETTDAERKRGPRPRDRVDEADGLVRPSGSSTCGIPPPSCWSNEKEDEVGLAAAVGDSCDSGPSAGSEALAREVGSFVPGASRAGISPSSAFSPSKNIRESLITLRVGRREWRSRRRAIGDAEKLLGLVGDGGADVAPSSHGSSGR